MAMRVNDDLSRFCFELESGRVIAQEPLDKSIKQETSACHLLEALQSKLGVIFNKHRIAGRLEEKYGRICMILPQCQKIMPPQLLGKVQVPYAEGGTSTAFSPLWQQDLETRSAQYLDCRNADLRFVITCERVIP